MAVTFPNESPEYRAARNQLLKEEVALRRTMEAVAASRRALPPGGLVPEDYLFDAIAPDGTPTKVKFSALFASGRNTLVAYHFMFPRHPGDARPGPDLGTTAEPPSAGWPMPLLYRLPRPARRHRAARRAENQLRRHCEVTHRSRRRLCLRSRMEAPASALRCEQCLQTRLPR
jgi:Bacterial protein of unknown function (DUF899)